MAEGGTPQFILDNGINYEVHTFTGPVPPASQAQNAYELKFTRKPAGGTVEVLVVAGGGGGGSSNSAGTGAGGGAGRFVYHPAFKVGDSDGEWAAAGTISVKVGAGGNPGGSNYQGYTGGDSEFVRHGSYQIIAKGGGGGGSGTHNKQKGLNGGSGGGYNEQVTTNGPGIAQPGTVPQDDEGIENLGHNGRQYGGGGAGENGMGKESAISGQSKWYAGGGYAYKSDTYKYLGIPGGITAGDQRWGVHGNAGNAESGTGDGGGGKYNGYGTAGGSGIVIVRWPYEELPQN
jgi:hypothetical protein